MTDVTTAPPAAGKAAAGGRLHLAPLMIGGVLALLALLAILAGPAMYRASMLDIETATLGIASIAFYVVCGGAALMVATLVACVMRKKTRGVIASLAGLTFALMIAFRIFAFEEQRANLPPIYDAQTDWSHPVAFSERVLRERAAANAAPIRDDAVLPDTAGHWAGKTVAQAQAEFYEVKPLLVNVAPPEATVAVANSAKQIGWLVMLSDPPNGQVEAVNYSPWYGLASDIAVRISPQGTGSRIDVRSTSRTPGPDMGANATRIKSLLDTTAFMLRSSSAPAAPPADKAATQ